MAAVYARVVLKECGGRFRISNDKRVCLVISLIHLFAYRCAGSSPVPQSVRNG